MPYREAPNVYGNKRTLSYGPVEWLDPNTFKDKQKRNCVEPYILSVDNEQIYIGKTLDSCFECDGAEVIGAVIKNSENDEWQLNVPYAGITIVCEKFAVLNISDPCSYYWKTSENGVIPENALRGAADDSAKEFLYIGQLITTGPDVCSGKVFEWPRWRIVDFPITPSMIGKVHPSHHLLYVPLEGREMAFHRYQILCLRPSTASLKDLSRMHVRKSIQMSRENIERLKTYMPDSLVQFIDYQNGIYFGDYMLKSDRLKFKNYQFYIDNENRLVCQRNNDSAPHYMDFKHALIYTNVHSLHCYYNRILVCIRNSSKYKIFLLFENDPYQPNDYVMSLKTNCDQTASENYLTASIQQFDSRNKVIAVIEKNLCADEDFIH
jgi:hypothetical protein